MEAGSGGLTPAAPVAFDLRQWRHQVRTARARIAAPGSVPLTTAADGIVAGAVIRAVGHPQRPVAVLPYASLRSHQVVIGTTGTGNTISESPFTSLRIVLQASPAECSPADAAVGADMGASSLADLGRSEVLAIGAISA